MDQATRPDYPALLRFLLEPLLDSPQSLKIDCEVLGQGSRVLIRIALEGEDKNRALGRGGRNIAAMRAIIQSVGRLANQSVSLDVFGGIGTEGDRRWEGSNSGGYGRRGPRSPRSDMPRSDMPRSGPPRARPRFPR
jgi:uncharacterized protein